MTCNECFEAFSSALDGELDPNEQTALEDHLESCADCQHLRARMLALSADLKAQPFPQQTAVQLKSLATDALAGAQATRWGWTRGWLRIPYENWPLRMALRLVSSGSLVLAVFVALIVRNLLPAYTGVEAVSKAGLPDTQAWLSWNPAPEMLLWGSVIVLVVGLWTSGIPGFLIDLWSGTGLALKDLVRLGLSTLLIGPVAAFPLLADLDLGGYILACSLWAGLCLLISYLLIAFKTQRPLPRLAVDFVGVTLLIGLLEWLGRTSLKSYDARDIERLLALLVGSASFKTLEESLGFLVLSFLFLTLGLGGVVPSYRAVGGRFAAALCLVLGTGMLVYGGSILGRLDVDTPVKAELVGPRRAYILGSSQKNPWLLSHLEFPRLDVNVVGAESSPRAAQLRLMAAFLDWNERAVLEVLASWSERAPGVTWGLTSFTDSLGVRKQDVLTVPSTERRDVIATMLRKLRWRVLDQVVLSESTGVVSGRVENYPGSPLRLMKVEDRESVDQVAGTLSQEQEMVAELLQTGSVRSNFSLPKYRFTTTDPTGRFEFSRVPDGNYMLVLFMNEPAALTLNASIPGLIQLKNGEQVEFSPIRLTTGEEGTDIQLNGPRWQTQGRVEFSMNSEVTTAKLGEGATLVGFVENEIFTGGKARIKGLVEGSTEARGSLNVRFFGKNGRLLKEWDTPLSGTAELNELEVDTEGLSGYLQLSFTSKLGSLTLMSVKLERLPNG
jgi:Putative zinc-finger